MLTADRVLCHICVASFGSASWLAVNALWVELPLIVPESPEGWSLPSYLTITVQLACAGPLVFGIIQKCAPDGVKKYRTFTISLLYLLSVTSMLLLALVRDETYSVAGEPHSVPLLTAAFLMSVSAATSNVAFLPSMALFRSEYTPSYFCGMGISGLLPCVMSLAQGSGSVVCERNVTTNETIESFQLPLFSVEAFSGVIIAWLVASFLCYSTVRYSAFFASERVPAAAVNFGSLDLNPEVRVSSYTFSLLLLFTGIVDALQNGVLPSVQSYACLPYGQSTYHYTVALSGVAVPFGSFATLFLPLKRVRTVTAFSVLACVGSAYILGLAALSPEPPLKGQTVGSMIVCLISAATSGLFMYVRTAMATMVREDTTRSNGLFWIGAATQIGSFLAAVVLFPLVSIEQVFHSAPNCAK